MTPIEKLREVMAALREPGTGCPWDVEQDFRSIAPYTIEEAYEVADAIARNDIAGLRDELGDLLLQVVFHARMAEEQGAFAFDDVAEAIAAKLVRRHPHVFADERVGSAAAQSIAWEAQKARERGSAGVLDGVARALPALSRAAKLGRRASGVGFDWLDIGGVADKVREELAEFEAVPPGDVARREEEIGDLLFSIANLARHAGVDPEAALRAANDKFERRFRAVEGAVAGSGRAWDAFSAADLDGLWREAKTRA
jgi:MazG family protein